MKKALLGVFILFSWVVRSQDFLGLQSSNYAGVLGVYSNAANIADNRMIVDVALTGLNFNFDNNYLGVKRSALSYTGSIFNPSGLVFPSSWQDKNYNSPTYYKNNFQVINNGKSKTFYSANRVVLPSFMITLNSKSAVAFTWSYRNFFNLSGISQDLADLIYSEFALDRLLNRRLTNNGLAFNQTAWAEFGLTYARVLYNKEKHFFKAGITPKLLRGRELVYFNIGKMDYLISTKDTFSFFNVAAGYGYSQNLDALASSLGSGFNPITSMKATNGLGIDFGAVYEWRPKYDTYSYDMDGKTGLIRRDKNKYKLKVSLAVNDLGGIRYKKGQYSNNFAVELTRFNVNKFGNVRDYQSFDSSLKAGGFSLANQPNYVRLAMPANINLQVDYHIWKPFYINFTGYFANLQSKTTFVKVYDYSNYSLAPRFDHKWFGLTVPFSHNMLAAQRGKNLQMGAMVRLGPFIMGTNDLSTYFKGDVFGANLYFLLRIPIPYGHLRDKDKDGVSNKKDKCKDVPGVWEFKGCPDRDHDHVQDSEDKCPDIPGLVKLSGCPDKDNDGITDAEDMCPDSAGTIEFKGCPDRDGDKIIDRHDLCPDVAGLAEFKGCPDKDGDGIQDKEDRCPDVFGIKKLKGCPDKDADDVADIDDACPTIAGPKEHKGCPDKDGDTVLDKDDDCPSVAGPLENKGCPWPDTDGDGIIDREDSCVTTPGEVKFKGCPPPMKAAEKKIIERAFASLEFATGKDVIKPKSLPSLNELAKLLIKHQDEWTLKLSGHTDNQGTPEGNLLLSEKRVNAVKNYLVKKGALEDRILTEWFGQSVPVADNATAAGRQKNRRVEMRIMYKE